MQDLLREISSGYILDLLPIDLTLHFLVGAFITVYGLKKNLSHKDIFILLVCIAGFKEIYDFSFHRYAGLEEYASDFAVTFSYFGLSLFVRQTKKHLDQKHYPAAS